jgi:hypothetical protein
MSCDVMNGGLCELYWMVGMELEKVIAQTFKMVDVIYC